MWWQLENPSLSSSRTSNEQPNQSNGTNTTQIIHISSQESTNIKSEKLIDNKMTIPTSEEFRKLSLENRRLELFSMLQTLLPLTERADALQGIFNEIDMYGYFVSKIVLSYCEKKIF